MLPRRPDLAFAEMNEFDPESRPDADPEGVLGATLCMLSCSLAGGSTHLLPQVATNLAWLSGCPRVGPDLRLVCRRLWEHWESACQQQKTH